MMKAKCPIVPIVVDIIKAGMTLPTNLNKVNRWLNGALLNSWRKEMTSSKRRTRGIVGTRHNQKTGEICQRAGTYRPECHWDRMDLSMPKGTSFPQCHVNEIGEVDVNEDGIIDAKASHDAVWHLVKVEEV